MMRAVVAWLAAGVGWSFVLALLWRLRQQHRLRAIWETVAVDAHIEALDQAKIALGVMRSSFDMVTAILLAQEKGLMESVEEDLRALAAELGDNVARAEEHLV